MQTKVYVNLGKRVAGAQIIKNYTWGYLVQVGFQCFKVPKEDIFTDFEKAKAAQFAETKRKKEESRREREGGY